MSNHRMRVFSTTFKEDVVRRLESGEALAAVSKELGIARKLLYEWRWAWRRHGAAGLNRRSRTRGGAAAEDRAVVMDAFSRKVVGWALADHLQASLPLEALDKAIASRGSSLKDLIHHSDRGVQYACRDYALRLSQIGAHASMSRPGTPQDNAKAESFMSTLKAEEVDGKASQSLKDAESRIGAFIDDVYNARRLHSSIGYKTPIEFEDEFRQAQKRETNQPIPMSQI